MLAQRNAEWTGHGPVLEQDIAITNISLDLLGQSRNCFNTPLHCTMVLTRRRKSDVDAFDTTALENVRP